MAAESEELEASEPKRPMTQLQYEAEGLPAGPTESLQNVQRLKSLESDSSRKEGAHSVGGSMRTGFSHLSVHLRLQPTGPYYPPSRQVFPPGFTDPQANPLWKQPHDHAQKYDLPIFWTAFNPARWRTKIQQHREFRRWNLEDSATVTVETEEHTDAKGSQEVKLNDRL